MSLVKLLSVGTSQSVEGSNTTEVEQEEFIQLKDKKKWSWWAAKMAQLVIT